ncbi:hypothetical protein AB4Z48_37095 [Cupriavidus sp. 2TAF22]|uniref:hypothetical protein n=1 Tax=unclassified Cupriavidus TaxID=2640874 RepID=UPI003F905245
MEFLDHRHQATNCGSLSFFNLLWRIKIRESALDPIKECGSNGVHLLNLHDDARMEDYMQLFAEGPNASSAQGQVAEAERTQPSPECTSAISGQICSDEIYVDTDRTLSEWPVRHASQTAPQLGMVHFAKSIKTDVPRGTVGRCVENPTSADLLHYIRAMVKSLRRAANESDESRDEGTERVLGALLRNAMDSASVLDIVVTLGCAAELSLYPEDAVLEQCTTAVRAAGKTALVGAVWAVRHRCARAGDSRRRFAA